MLGLTLENDLTPDKRYIFSQLLHQKSGWLFLSWWDSAQFWWWILKDVRVLFHLSKPQSADGFCEPDLLIYGVILSSNHQPCAEIPLTDKKYPVPAIECIQTALWRRKHWYVTCQLVCILLSLQKGFMRTGAVLLKSNPQPAGIVF
jgi:hypothetical protein